jgi:hypothetical protein
LLICYYYCNSEIDYYCNSEIDYYCNSEIDYYCNSEIDYYCNSEIILHRINFRNPRLNLIYLLLKYTAPK